MKTQSKNLYIYILRETKDCNLLYLTKTALKRTSNTIFNMKIVDLDGKLQVILLSAERNCTCTLSNPLWKK